MLTLQYNFEWDPDKAKINWQKHKVRFEHSATVFRDPKALTIYDDEHSENEDPWITLGLASTGVLLIVHHTFNQLSDSNVNIRIISSRKPIKREKQQYQE